jgi:tetratricopeptide (TPR) repeat protein
MKYAIRSLLFVLIVSTAYSQLTINQNKKVTTEMIKIIAVKALQHHIRTGSFVGFEIPEELRQDCYSTETQFDIDADSEKCSIIGSPNNYTDCLVTGIVKYSNRVVKVVKENPLEKEVKLTENALTEALKITYKGYSSDIESNVNPQVIKIDSANAKHDQQNYQRAIAYFTEAIKANPNNANAYLQRGIGKSSFKDYEGAIADFTKVIKLRAKDAMAYGQRGYAKFQLEDDQGAIADCTKAIKLKPDCALAYFVRGSAFGVLQQYKKAKSDFMRAIKLGFRVPQELLDECNENSNGLEQYIPPGHPPQYDDASLKKLIGLPIKTIISILGSPEDDYYLEAAGQRQLRFIVLYKSEFSDPKPTRVLLVFKKQNKSDWVCIKSHPL